MVDLDAVRRGKNTAAGRGDAVELRHRPARVIAVLEHLRAENEVEAAGFERYVLDGSDHIRGRSGTTSRPMYSVAILAKKGKYGLHPAADVQDPDTGTGRLQLLGLRLKPSRDGRTNEPRGRRARGVPPLLSRPRLARGDGGSPKATWFHSAMLATGTSRGRSSVRGRRQPACGAPWVRLPTARARTRSRR